MSQKRKKGFWINEIAPDGKKTRKFVGDDSTEAKIGKMISNWIDKLLR